MPRPSPLNDLSLKFQKIVKKKLKTWQDFIIDLLMQIPCFYKKNEKLLNCEGKILNRHCIQVFSMGNPFSSFLRLQDKVKLNKNQSKKYFVAFLSEIRQKMSPIFLRKCKNNVENKKTPMSGTPKPYIL